MPWHITKTGRCPAAKPWGVIKDSDNSVAGCHATEDDAKKQLAALYANEPSNVNWERIIGYIREAFTDGE